MMSDHWISVPIAIASQFGTRTVAADLPFNHNKTILARALKIMEVRATHMSHALYFRYIFLLVVPSDVTVHALTFVCSFYVNSRLNY